MLVDPAYQPLLRQIGLDADAVFTHPDIRVWRAIPERENATLDATLPDGKHIRLHIKRYAKTWANPAADEAHGIMLLVRRGIPTVPLVAWGRLRDGRSFIITEDLSGYEALDKLIESGLAFDTVRDAVADLAAQLHAAELHHRDLYLCHFFACTDAGKVDLRLIDAGRVKPLPRWPFRERWIVKDLSQLWYSTLALPVTPDQRLALLRRYGQRRGLVSILPLQRSIEKKIRRIARHDARLNRAHPTRNVSIPDRGQIQKRT